MARPKKSELQKRADNLQNKSQGWWVQYPEKLALLEMAYKLDCTDAEACANAEISLDQLYYFQKHVNPDFQVKKHLWKQEMFLKARKTIEMGIAVDPKVALDYMKHKKSTEFNTKQIIEGGMKHEHVLLGGVVVSHQGQVKVHDEVEDLKKSIVNRFNAVGLDMSSEQPVFADVVDGEVVDDTQD